VLLAVLACLVTGGPAAATPSGVLPFGCANPSGHVAARLLPAAQGSAGAGVVTCFGRLVLGVGSLAPAITPGPVGYGPRQIQGAYGLAGTNAHGRVVAVVDAFDDPKAEADLGVYRRAYGLPPCTTANGCFRKVNQYGHARPLPARDYGWATEISLDLDAISAACPSCHILLVEAVGAVPDAMSTAVESAVRLGAVAVANSWGGPELRSLLPLDARLRHSGVAITVASGDRGFGVDWPASSPYVIAVGGTTLKRAANARGWTETAWSGGGSGCSRYEPKPSWQHDRGCARRTVADVAADGDPATGLGIYDTFNNCLLKLLCDTQIATGTAKGLNGWAKAGGTSLAAPLVAAVYALAGNHRGAAYAYAHAGSLNDVRAGSNGLCGGSYLCTARRGYDGPTGLGTPRGLGAF
jgi:subtilase family serine protease